jgi:hypothetical protein
MKFFLDTEFIESGHLNPIQLVSIGVVAEDGREFYAISSQFNPDMANEWVRENVLAKLESPEDFPRKLLKDIAAELQEFVGPEKPEFWGYYADYDWVVVAQMFGRMVDLPKGWPMYCRDIKQLAVELGDPKLPEQGKGEHNALADAQWNKVAYEFLMAKTADFRIVGKNSGAGRITDERLRQIKVEGWTPDHDDQHGLCELNRAARSYLRAAELIVDGNSLNCIGVKHPTEWPWAREWWKPTDDPIRNLEKAGALIAAEIDRLQRKAEHGS